MWNVQDQSRILVEINGRGGFRKIFFAPILRSSIKWSPNKLLAALLTTTVSESANHINVLF